MQKINSALYIDDNDPVAVTARSPATWFVDETQNDVPDDSVGWMEAQGWVSTGKEVRSGTMWHSMKRRRIDPEKVLKDLVSDYTASYNEGRELNDQRYDDIVAIYCAMQSVTEDEYNVQQAGDVSYDSLIETIITAIGTDHDDYSDDVDGALDDFGDSIRSQIATRFDNRLAAARQELTSRGMYNSTVWDSIAAGVERERSLALSDIEDKITQQQLDLKHRVHGEKVGMRTRILAARDRLWTAVSGASDRRLASRNAIITALVNFMERRTDSYPDLDQVGRLAANLGAGNPTGVRS